MSNAQRIYSLQIYCASEPAYEIRLTTLVNCDTTNELGGVLIKLYSAVTVCRGLLNAIEGANAKVRIEAADRYLLVPSEYPLASKTRQTRQRVGDAHIRKLPYVLGRNHLDDRTIPLLLKGRSLERTGITSVNRVGVEDYWGFGCS